MAEFPAVPAPTCPYGHGALDLIMGDYALAGIERVGLQVPDRPRQARPDGRLFTVKLWRCPDCGTVVLRDAE